MLLETRFNNKFSQGEQMNYQELKSRHQELESIVDQSYKNYVSDEIIKRYKKEKLKIKEQIDRLEHS